MSMSTSLSKRRAVVVINYSLLLATLLLSQTGHWFEWSIVTKAGFIVLVISVIATFFPLHMRTGLYRLAHAKVETLDERELQKNLESVRYAYLAFTVISLLIILTIVVFGSGGQTQQLAVFWILLYLAHTLPSSFLAWTATRSFPVRILASILSTGAGVSGVLTLLATPTSMLPFPPRAFRS